MQCNSVTRDTSRQTLSKLTGTEADRKCNKILDEEGNFNTFKLLWNVILFDIRRWMFLATCYQEVHSRSIQGFFDHQELSVMIDSLSMLKKISNLMDGYTDKLLFFEHSWLQCLQECGLVVYVSQVKSTKVDNR